VGRGTRKAVSTATSTPAPNPSKKVTQRERRAYLAHFRRRGWTQNEAGRRIGKDQGLFGRWLRGEISSAPIRRATDALLASTPELEHLALAVAGTDDLLSVRGASRGW